MFEVQGRELVVRTNQAVLPVSDAARRRQAAERSPTAAASTASANRAGLLSRMARAARQAVHEARASGDVPLPHLYRGRDFHKSREAA